MDTIYALSSGRPPAAIAVMRISGRAAFDAAAALTGTLPPDRMAKVRTLRSADGATLDRALVLCFRGPHTATGEDLVELHLHGGRAVVAAVENALGSFEGMRPALAGEFTRRALENGRVDYFQAQGLADLLEAETEGQRRAAVAASEGFVGRSIADWLTRLADLAARIGASIDYADEGDVSDEVDAAFETDLARLKSEISAVLDRPTVERLRDGHLVVLAGPPNAGKSSLFNAMLGRDAAIVADVAGTTRDAIEASVVRNGQAFRLVDTAGLAEESDDPIELMGIERAKALVGTADVVLWLGDLSEAPEGSQHILSKADLRPPCADGLAVSIHDPTSVDRVWSLVEQSTHRSALFDDVRLHEAQRTHLISVDRALADAGSGDDIVLRAEAMRVALYHLGDLMGVRPTDTMLTALFSRFCVGK